MYMNPQRTETSLSDEIQELLDRIESMGVPRDRKTKHAESFLKQMVKTKRAQLASLRNRSASGQPKLSIV